MNRNLKVFEQGGSRTGSVLARVAVALVLVAGMLAGAVDHAAAQGGSRVPATVTNPKILGGIHDTAINDCDGSGGSNPKSANATVATPNLPAAQASFNSPYWPSGVQTVRVTVPWDMADPNVLHGHGRRSRVGDYNELKTVQACFNAWLSAAISHHVQPEVDFRDDPNYVVDRTKLPADTAKLMPTDDQYKTALAAFRDQYVTCGTSCAAGGAVTIIGAWNEPDNPNRALSGSYRLKLATNDREYLNGSQCPTSSPRDCGAAEAAHLFVMAKQTIQNQGCPGCTMLMGDFSGNRADENVSGKNGKKKYLDFYMGELQKAGVRAPGTWAMHPYPDINRFQNSKPSSPTGLAKFANRLKAYHYGSGSRIWLNEVSVVNYPKRPSSQNAAMKYLINKLPTTVPAGDPQVAQIGYYCFSDSEAACSTKWALVRNGTPTAAYQTFKTWLNGPTS